MVEKGDSRNVKLPKGLWMDDLGKKYKGGQTVKMMVPLNRLVYFSKLKQFNNYKKYDLDAI